MLSKLDPGSLQAARDLGAGPGAILRDVVLPLLRPGIWVSLLLSFVRSLADFGTPVIIGGRFSTIASEILQAEPPRLDGVSAGSYGNIYQLLLFQSSRKGSQAKSGEQFCPPENQEGSKKIV